MDIISRADGTFVTTKDGLPYHVVQSDPMFSEVSTYATEHPEDVTDEPAPAGMTLEQARANKMAEIIGASNAAMSTLTASYSEHEKLSWPKQEAEALAYDADSGAATPLLSAIATARGISVSALAARVLGNVTAYTAASGTILGHQQAYEDAVAAAETVAEVEAIDPTF